MRTPLIANVLGYQLVWFACVGGAAAGHLWPGLLASLLFTALTLGLGGRQREDLGILLVAVPLGLALDSAFVLSGWMSYAPAAAPPLVVPAWIGAIWVAFAMTLNHSLAFLRQRAWLAAALGLVAAPLAYWGAARGFGVLRFSVPLPWVLSALGLAWALLLPLTYHLDSRLQRRQAPA